MSVLCSTAAAKNDALLVREQGLTIASVLDTHEAAAEGRRAGKWRLICGLR